MIELEKQIESIAIRLPNLPTKTRKNIYDILGVQKKESANSKVLAYFLDPNEEHRFHNLFFDSLKELIDEKKYDGANVDLEIFDGNFKIVTEDQTFLAEDEKEKQKRIDLSIEGENWCIIIENKINHVLNNPLETYWKHAQKKFGSNVLGVVLSIREHTQKECVVNDKIKYINITHKELIKRVQKNLIFGPKINDTSLLYLKEYIKNIESHYKSIIDEPKMNEIVKAIVKQGENTQAILEKVEKSIKFIDSEIIEVFESYGFSKDKSWFKNNNLHEDIYFWIHDSKTILLNNSLWFCFETRNQTDRNLDKTKLKNLYDDFNIFDYRLKYGNHDNSKSRTHIAIFSQGDFIKEGESFKEAFTKVLDTFFMNTEFGIVYKTVKYINDNIKTSTSSLT